MRLFLSAVILSITSLGYCGDWYNDSKKNLPSPNSYISEGVYVSSNISTYYAGIISSSPVILHTIVVGSTDTLGVLEIFDTFVSTSSSNIRKVSMIDTRSSGSYLFDIWMSSGLGVFNRGISTPTAANVTFTYRKQ